MATMEVQGKVWEAEVGSASDAKEKVREEFYQKRAELKDVVDLSVAGLVMSETKISKSGKWLFGALEDAFGSEEKAYKVLQFASAGGLDGGHFNVDLFAPNWTASIEGGYLIKRDAEGNVREKVQLYKVAGVPERTEPEPTRASEPAPVPVEPVPAAEPTPAEVVEAAPASSSGSSQRTGETPTVAPSTTEVVNETAARPTIDLAVASPLDPEAPPVPDAAPEDLSKLTPEQLAKKTDELNRTIENFPDRLRSEYDDYLSTTPSSDNPMLTPPMLDVVGTPFALGTSFYTLEFTEKGGSTPTVRAEGLVDAGALDLSPHLDRNALITYLSLKSLAEDLETQWAALKPQIDRRKVEYEKNHSTPASDVPTVSTTDSTTTSRTPQELEALIGKRATESFGEGEPHSAPSVPAAVNTQAPASTPPAVEAPLAPPPPADVPTVNKDKSSFKERRQERKNEQNDALLRENMSKNMGTARPESYEKVLTFYNQLANKNDQDHLMAAEAAKNLGDIAHTKEFLGKVNADGLTEAQNKLSDIQRAYAPVQFLLDDTYKYDLTANMESITNGQQRAAISFVKNLLRGNTQDMGLVYLPEGTYTIAGQKPVSFTVQAGRPVEVDMKPKTDPEPIDREQALQKLTDSISGLGESIWFDLQPSQLGGMRIQAPHSIKALDNVASARVALDVSDPGHRYILEELAEIEDFQTELIPIVEAVSKLQFEVSEAKALGTLQIPDKKAALLASYKAIQDQISNLKRNPDHGWATDSHLLSDKQLAFPQSLYGLNRDKNFLIDLLETQRSAIEEK